MRKSTYSRALKHAGGLASALACLCAAAQQGQPPADAWQFEFVPYLWAPGIKSDLRFGVSSRSTTSVNSSSVLSALDYGAMGTLEARKGPWGALLDMQYVKLGVSRQVGIFPPVGLDVDYTQQIYTLAGLYRVYESAAFQVDVLGGARYVNARTDVEFAPNLPGPGIRQSVGWWNGLVGARVIAPINDRWSVLGYLDRGWGNSTSSWEAIAGASYLYSPTISFKFGYRYMRFERDEGLLSKVALGGFFAGAGFKF